MTGPEKAAYLFIAPSMLILTVFVFIPLIASFFISFMNLNLFLTKRDFVGFANYIKAFQTARVWNSFGNTFYFVLLEVPLQVLVGLVVAAALTANRWFERAMRSIFFLPVLCSLTAVGLIWSLILDPTHRHDPLLADAAGAAQDRVFEGHRPRDAHPRADHRVEKTRGRRWWSWARGLTRHFFQLL